MQCKESIEKVLFLDIDGVLNRAEYGKDTYEETYADYCVCLHRPSVEALRKLLSKEPNLKIVWITDWAKFEPNACNANHCYLDPRHALEQFPWIKSRIIGSVFVGEHSYARGDKKMLAVKSFIEENLVEAYAILDDDIYKNTQDTEHMHDHFIRINPLKSFLEDDIPLVEKALSLPTDGDAIHSMLLKMDYTDSFVVNGRYLCKFDFSKFNQKKAPLFTDFKKDENCPRMIAEVDVLVYDEKIGENKLGRIFLNIEKDLCSRKCASFFVKPLEASKWEMGTTSIWLSKMKKSIGNEEEID